ncbi:hypothetical protein FOTG_19138 [Fusarium oxysporum f. sp. vasinfectum 25433]|uniref:Uncharacterized protein n=1 Tax=Fusarium oxysporum f. sp. vasinfectum 25433 TaxID=1089449 RepID=X0KUM2_FUSOX|nr:hypothetical protein FOTG_19138 [Fusarium oxysporum f. sp. vasinfectum 25433]
MRESLYMKDAGGKNSRKRSTLCHQGFSSGLPWWWMKLWKIMIWVSAYLGSYGGLRKCQWSSRSCTKRC